MGLEAAKSRLEAEARRMEEEAARLRERAAGSGLAAGRIRPMESGGDQGTRALTAELVALVAEVGD